MTALDSWVTSLRGPKVDLDPHRAHGAFWEEEADGHGGVASTAVVFITNRECPFRCVMCDLWRHTLDVSPPPGAVPTQIAEALASLPAARWVKLYNAGSFFDTGAIPIGDDAAIARLVEGHERVVVESHPAFLGGVYGDRCLRLRDAVTGRLEVAIGLESAHPGVLQRLNKRMTLAGFRRAADFLAGESIDLRVFILLNPPFLSAEEALEWTCRSIDLARQCGARACTIIPTRRGNGAMEHVQPRPAPPSVADLETVVRYGLERGGLVVLADLWNIEQFAHGREDAQRVGRLARMNREQRIPPAAERSDRS
jgi:radical SAM enzyme (TIGR01210 family)